MIADQIAGLDERALEDTRADQEEFGAFARRMAAGETLSETEMRRLAELMLALKIPRERLDEKLEEALKIIRRYASITAELAEMPDADSISEKRQAACDARDVARQAARDAEKLITQYDWQQRDRLELIKAQAALRTDNGILLGLSA